MRAFDISTGVTLLAVIIFGLFGNIVSFFVWTKGRRCRKSPGALYLRALAISDSIALCLPAMNELITLLSGIGPQHQNTVLCKLETTGRHFGLLVSSWIVSSFSMERTIAIFKANVTASIFGKTRTISFIIMIFIVNFFLNLPYGTVHSVGSVAEGQQRGISNESMKVFIIPGININETSKNETHFKQECTCDPSSFFSFLNWYHTWFMDFVLIFIIPFTLITVSNIMVMCLVILRRSAARSRVKGVTIRAISVSILHCVTTGPFSIAVLIPGHLDRALTVKDSDEYYINKMFLLLSFINHALNFVLYSCLGTDFRKDFKEIIRRKTSVVNPENSIKQKPQANGAFDMTQIA